MLGRWDAGTLRRCEGAGVLACCSLHHWMRLAGGRRSFQVVDSRPNQSLIATVPWPRLASWPDGERDIPDCTANFAQDRARRHCNSDQRQSPHPTLRKGLAGGGCPSCVHPIPLQLAGVPFQPGTGHASFRVGGFVYVHRPSQMPEFCRVASGRPHWLLLPVARCPLHAVPWLQTTGIRTYVLQRAKRPVGIRNIQARTECQWSADGRFPSAPSDPACSVSQPTSVRTSLATALVRIQSCSFPLSPVNS